MKIGILGAMLEEVASIKQLMVITRENHIAGRNYIEGTINSIDVVLTFSRWGKVAASCTTAVLINKFNTDFILFTGVAGAVHPMLSLGDIIIGDGHYQHDMDARPLFEKYQIPLTNNLLFKPQIALVSAARAASEKFIQKMEQSLNAETLAQFSIVKPLVYCGIIASGDQFISDPMDHNDLSYECNGRKTLAVEMEGAAVAQVCEEHETPYIIIRIISDKADHSAAIDFQSFIKSVASQYSAGILKEFFQALSTEISVA